MGSRGPVPKRAEERAGHRAKDDKPDHVAITSTVDAPPANPKWGPAARSWYDSLQLSGQAKYFEPSDWQQARITADLLTEELKDSPVYVELRRLARSIADKLGRGVAEIAHDDDSVAELMDAVRVFLRVAARLTPGPTAAMMKEILKAMADLGTTEASRRRMRVEVQRPTEDPDEFDVPAPRLTAIAGGR